MGNNCDQKGSLGKIQKIRQNTRLLGIQKNCQKRGVEV